MESGTADIAVKNRRAFLPQNITIDSWSKVEPFYIELRDRTIASLADLNKWLLDRSELEAVMSEDLGWRYIRSTCNTQNQEYDKAYNFFIQEIEPKAAPYRNSFNKKFMESPFLKEIDKKRYAIYLRAIKQEQEVYRENNIPLITEVQADSLKYGTITSLMTVTIDSKELTLQEANVYLENTDRNKRKEAYEKIQERRKKDRAELNELFNNLLGLRDTIAKNADFKNYRDYSFKSMGRFDYSVKDCFDFHESVLKEIVPAVNEYSKKFKRNLKLDSLRPWDTSADETGKPPLKPFQTDKELTSKAIECFTKVRPFYGECLARMQKLDHLDLASRKGKSPGGYNYPLYETGIPFIFMNAVGTLGDVITMVHEGGHAVHSIVTRDLELTGFKDVPSEVAELASMSMELISMEHWDVFFKDPEDLKRAKKDQLEKILHVLPWIASVDKFQHWIYENPKHTNEERYAEWMKIMKKFGDEVVDWSGCEDNLENLWQKQLHIFEIPFYYIEYGMAQLGAIAVWRNYKANPAKALDAYENALKLGYTKSIKEIYKTAGIEFNFSASYIKELVDFVNKEMDKL